MRQHHLTMPYRPLTGRSVSVQPLRYSTACAWMPPARLGSTCSQGYRYLNTTQHFFPRSPIPREMCPTWATRNATWHESCARAVHSGGSTMASMVMARPPTAVAVDGRAVRARQGGPSTFPFMSEVPKWGRHRWGRYKKGTKPPNLFLQNNL